MPRAERTMQAPFLFARYGEPSDFKKDPAMTMERCLPTLRCSADVVAKTHAQLKMGNTRGGTRTYGVGDQILDQIRTDIKSKQSNEQYMKRPNPVLAHQTTCIRKSKEKDMWQSPLLIPDLI